MQAKIHVEHGPFKKSYASIADLDLTEDTSLPLNPHLYYLLVTDLGITDIQPCKAALSDPDTLTYDQALLDPDIEEWKKVPTKKSPSWKAKTHGLKSQLQKPLPRFFQAYGYLVTKELLQESSPSSRQDIVSEETHKKTYPKPFHQLSHEAQSGLYLSSPLPKNQKWHHICVDFNNTLSKLTSRIQYGYILPEDTNPSQAHIHVSDSRKSSLICFSVTPKLWYQYL